jgi:hypothetical protein
MQEILVSLRKGTFMRLKFNPLTGKMDLVESLSIREVISSILVESNETLTLHKAEILFDENSVLYNDDCEDL